VIGIDDWAFKKGLRYGTILVDLERHYPIDLLPDRQVETVRQWLAQHPSVEIVTRDRSQDYAQAITQGAPQAVQIADCWHLLKNLTDALYKVLHSYAKRLRWWGVDPQTMVIQAVDVPERSPSRHERHQRHVRRAVRLERYQQVWLQKSIACHLGISARTVSRYLAAATFPERQQQHRTSGLDRYKTYLLRRWSEGCHNATRLADEIRFQGYAGGITQVRDYVARLRQVQAAQTGQLSLSLPTSLASKPLTPRRAAFLLLCPLDGNNATLVDFRQQFFSLFPALQAIVEPFQAFAAMVREKRAADFADWLWTASHSACTALKQFARGFERDEAAVRAALSSHWNNGQCEGQINRLKFLKRQMYGQSLTCCGSVCCIPP
jgi:transposase